MNEWFERDSIDTVECEGFVLDTRYMLWRRDDRFLLHTSLKENTRNLSEFLRSMRGQLKKHHPDKSKEVLNDVGRHSHSLVEKFNMIVNPPPYERVLKLVSEKCHQEWTSVVEFVEYSEVHSFCVLLGLLESSVGAISYDRGDVFQLLSEQVQNVLREMVRIRPERFELWLSVVVNGGDWFGVTKEVFDMLRNSINAEHVFDIDVRFVEHCFSHRQIIFTEDWFAVYDKDFERFLWLENDFTPEGSESGADNNCFGIFFENQPLKLLVDGSVKVGDITVVNTRKLRSYINNRLENKNV